MSVNKHLTHQFVGMAWDQIARYVPWPRFDRAEYKPLIDGVVRGLDPMIERDETWHEFIEIWRIVNQYSALDIYRAKTIYDLLIQSKNIEGSIYEFGSYMGGTGILLGILAKRLGLKKHVYLFDSFQGLPSLSADEMSVHEYWEGAFIGKRDIIEDQISKNGLEDCVSIHEGWFQDTLKNIHGPVSFAHFDADIYTSTKMALDATYPYTNHGSVLVFDDYFDLTQGVRRAVDEGIDDNEMIQLAPLPMTFVTKGFKQKDEDGRILIDDRPYSIAYLVQQRHWLTYYNGLIKKLEKEIACMHAFQKISFFH